MVIKKLNSALRHSLRGMSASLRQDMSVRLQWVLFVVLITVALFVNVTTIERLFLLIAPFLLVVVELINTAIERANDAISKSFSTDIQLSKDCASAAVLMTLIMVVLVYSVIIFG